MSENGAEYVWEEKGVKVVIPPQSQSVEINEKDVGDPPNTNVFERQRLIINFEVLVAGAKTETHVASFNPPMVITVGKNPGEEEWHKLGYWKNNAWNAMWDKQVPTPFRDFEYAFETEVNFQWDDPAMAWGT